jgi:hypothetical protein
MSRRYCAVCSNGQTTPPPSLLPPPPIESLVRLPGTNLQSGSRLRSTSRNCRHPISLTILMIYSCHTSLPRIPSFGALFQRDAAGLDDGKGHQISSPPLLTPSRWASTRFAHQVIFMRTGIIEAAGVLTKSSTSKVTLRIVIARRVFIRTTAP